MQLARNLNIGFGLERTWERKIKEIFTSIQIERTYSKTEIIEMYLNINFFGSNSYGIQSAARNFFSKDVGDLTIELKPGDMLLSPTGTTHFSMSCQERIIVSWGLHK